jgi:thiosulfate/3-mercaptopyruvate sulfurtransferase
MPNSPRKPTAEYLAGPRIPGAIRWDLDKIANPRTDAGAGLAEPEEWTSSGLERNDLGLGHMLPGPARFAEACCE